MVKSNGVNSNVVNSNGVNNNGINSSGINNDWVPTINRQFRLQWEAAQDCYVLLYPEGMVKLNTSAGEILSRCDGQRSQGEIIHSLAQQFPEAENIAGDICDFFTVARNNQWLNDD